MPHSVLRTRSIETETIVVLEDARFLTDDGYLDSVSEDSPAEDISVLDVEIVVNHGGSIEAVPSEAEGARIVVERPL